MSTTRLRDGEHRCDVPFPAIEGEVRRCDECGATWIGRDPGAPEFNCWKRLGWLGRKFRGLP